MLRPLSLIAAMGCLASISTLNALSHAAEQPNVLFIAVDDLRCELGCYGVSAIQSPNLDGLAESGVVFTRAYCQQAVCNPSRVSLMTGLRPDSTKVWDLVTDFRTTIPDAVTIPQHFRQHGYRALGFGKIFHNTFPDDVSWDEPHQWPKKSRLWSAAALQQLAEVKEQMRAEGKPTAAIKRLRSLGTERVDIPDNEHVDGAIAEQALAAMRALAAGEQPFFLAAGFVRPHLPFVVPRKYWDLYDPAKIPLATNRFLPHGAPGVAFGDRSLGGFYELRDYMDYRDTPSPFDASLAESQQRKLKHGYYAAVSFIDVLVGRLLDELDRLGLAENTIVVLWGDHGWKLGEHNGWCKQTNYEIDTRSPLIVRAPGAKANGKPSHALVEFVDIYPTLCDLAGLPVPKQLDGVSLAALLRGTAEHVKGAAFSQFPRKHEGRDYMGYAIRTERYRYVEWWDRATGTIAARELYDHKTDSEENQNIADLEANAGTVAELSARLAKQFDVPPPRVVKPTKTDAPNILFIMGDDWSWPHAGVLGDPVVKTPAFDRVAREGVLFPNAFVSSPSCTPSRLAVATGQWHWRLEDGKNLGGALREGVPVYPEMLQAAGYQIGFAHKGGTPSDYRYTHRDPFGPRFKTFEEFVAQRKPGTPFCFWHGPSDTHRPYRYGESEAAGIDPERTFTLAGMDQHVYTTPCRALRTADYLYIRNFDPANWPTGESTEPVPPISFTDGSWPNDGRYWPFNIDPSPTSQLLLDHRSNPAVRPFFELACGVRPEEELYDLRADPDQLRNIAADANHAATLAELRKRLMSELRASADPLLESHSNTAESRRPVLQILSGSRQPNASIPDGKRIAGCCSSDLLNRRSSAACPF